MGRRKNNVKQTIHIVEVVVVLILMLLGKEYVIDDMIYAFSNETENQNSVATANTNTEVDSTLKVYYLDVGQADSILIQDNNQNMLIDAGNNGDGKYLVKYFKELGITKFDYLVGTHPHEDHIGGLDNVIKNFDIDKVLLPDVSTTTETYEDVLDALIEKNLKVTTPKIGDNFKMSDCDFSVMSIGTDATDLNETSIVLKMQFGNKKFIFTGDATSKNEKNMLDKDISADVLKVGHHGSEYSTCQEFLDKVNPQYAIISVGKGNKYGHPTSQTLNKLKAKNITIYRTDESGTILLTSDGENINFETIKTRNK